MSNEEVNVRIQELEKQLGVINTAIDVQSNDPDSWATLKYAPGFELIGQMALIDLFRFNIKLKDELSGLKDELSRLKDELSRLEKAEQAEKIRLLESMVYNIPSIDPVTANATATKKVSDLFLVGPAGPNQASEFAATVSLPFQGVGFFVSSHDVDFSAVGTRRPRSATWFLKDASTLADNDTFTTDNGRLMTVKNGANKLFDILLFNSDLSKLAETPTSEASQRKGLVSKDFLPELGKAFFPNMFSSERRSLKDLGCPVGLATSGSTPDGYLFGPSTSPQGKKVIRGIVEAKNSTMEVHVAMRQGISEAINVAMQLLTGGVRWAEVVVPILATNGHTLQIGVVYLLYATFPVFTFATRELHLLNADDRQEAVRVLVCLQRFLREELPANTKYLPPTTTTPAPTSSSTAVAAATATGTESSVSSIAVLDARHGGDGSIPPVPPSTRPSDRDAESPLPSLSQLRDALPNIPTEPPSTIDPASQSEWNPLQRRFLDKSLYYFKELRSMYFAYGPTQVERSLRMYFEVMKALYRVEACRDSVVFPICLRQYEKDAQESGLVFPRLEQPKYRIGLPRDAAKRTAYFEALWSAVKVIHEEARVLHLDLYPSNIMWCWDEVAGRVQIKLIDWDAAVLMDWHELPPQTASTLSTYNRYTLASAYSKEIVGLSSSLDTCFIHLLEENQGVEGLWSEAKETLDRTFRELVMKKLDLPTSEGFYMHEQGPAATEQSADG